MLERLSFGALLDRLHRKIWVFVGIRCEKNQAPKFQSHSDSL